LPTKALAAMLGLNFLEMDQKLFEEMPVE